MSLYASVWWNWMCYMWWLRLKGNQGTMITHAPISFRMVEYDCYYDWMMNVFAIILIEMKLEYWGLKGNQGTVIADGSLWG